jgi:hypothetical protein
MAEAYDPELGTAEQQKLNSMSAVEQFDYLRKAGVQLERPTPPAQRFKKIITYTVLLAGVISIVGSAGWAITVIPVMQSSIALASAGGIVVALAGLGFVAYKYFSAPPVSKQEQIIKLAKKDASLSHQDDAFWKAFEVQAKAHQGNGGIDGYMSYRTALDDLFNASRVKLSKDGIKEAKKRTAQELKTYRGRLNESEQMVLAELLAKEAPRIQAANPTVAKVAPVAPDSLKDSDVKKLTPKQIAFWREFDQTASILRNTALDQKLSSYFSFIASIRTLLKDNESFINAEMNAKAIARIEEELSAYKNRFDGYRAELMATEGKIDYKLAADLQKLTIFDRSVKTYFEDRDPADLKTETPILETIVEEKGIRMPTEQLVARQQELIALQKEILSDDSRTADKLDVYQAQRDALVAKVNKNAVEKPLSVVDSALLDYKTDLRTHVPKFLIRADEIAGQYREYNQHAYEGHVNKWWEDTKKIGFGTNLQLYTVIQEKHNELLARINKSAVHPGTMGGHGGGAGLGARFRQKFLSPREFFAAALFIPILFSQGLAASLLTTGVVGSSVGALYLIQKLAIPFVQRLIAERRTRMGGMPVTRRDFASAA